LEQNEKYIYIHTKILWIKLIHILSKLTKEGQLNHSDGDQGNEEEIENRNIFLNELLVNACKHYKII